MNLRELLGLGVDPNQIMPGLVADPNRDNTGKLTNSNMTELNNIKPTIQDIQLDNNGQIMSDEQRVYENAKNAPMTLRERLFGRTVATVPTEQEITIKDENGNDQTIKTKVAGLETVNNGWLNDFVNGYKDNYNNGFRVSNWNDSDKAKTIAERLGEGLGTTLRFIDSPGGRALITGGVGLALGATPAEAIAYGTNAGNMHSKLQTDNNAYRNLLEQQGLDTSKLGNGWVDKDLAQTYALNNYRNMNLQTRRDIANLSSNTQRARMIAGMLNQGTMTPQEAMSLMNTYGITTNDLRISNATRNADINAYLAPHRANAYDTGAIVGLGNLGLRQELQPYQIDNLQASTQQKRESTLSGKLELQSMTDQIRLFEDNFVNVPQDKANAILSNLKANAGFGGDNETYFNSQKAQLYNKIARTLGNEKGVLSDQDMKRIEQSIPNLSDSLAQKRAKMKAINDLINIRVNEYNQRMGLVGNTPYAIPQSGTTKNGLKYKVLN